MRILAIETIDKTGTLAALDDGELLAELALDQKLRSAQTLVPGIRSLLKNVGWEVDDVQLVAVASGPGSFTGLRIGVTTAKTFAYVTGCEVLAVNSLAAIGDRLPLEYARFSVVIDAQRDELFVADLVRQGDGSLMGEESTRLVAGDRWGSELAPGSVVTGPGLTKWVEKLGSGVNVVDKVYWQPSAAAVGRVAWRQYEAGRRDELLELVPKYFRRTAAEEQWERKQQSTTDEVR